MLIGAEIQNSAPIDNASETKMNCCKKFAPCCFKKHGTIGSKPLEAVGVPCSPINSLPQSLETPQVQALGLGQVVPGEDSPQLTGLPLSFNGQRPPIQSGAPQLGQHNKDFNILDPTQPFIKYKP
jgi:hypothetical protein